MTTSLHAGPATFQRKSANDKLSHVRRVRHANGRYQTFPQAPYVCSTYVSIESTCPDTCTFKGHGCYVQDGQSSMAMQKLDKAGEGIEGTEVNKMEADLINARWVCGIPQDGYGGGRDLRLHVGGDFASVKGAVALGLASESWRHRGGGQVWAYTHRWREIWAEDFGPDLHVLASVETPEEAEQAIHDGYTPAITVVSFYRARAYNIPGHNHLKIIPCPAQTRHRKCNECRLCFKPLPKGVMIGFQLHGMGASKARKRLTVLGQETMPWR